MVGESVDTKAVEVNNTTSSKISIDSESKPRAIGTENMAVKVASTSSTELSNDLDINDMLSSMKKKLGNWNRRIMHQNQVQSRGQISANVKLDGCVDGIPKIDTNMTFSTSQTAARNEKSDTLSLSSNQIRSFKEVISLNDASKTRPKSSSGVYPLVSTEATRATSSSTEDDAYGNSSPSVASSFSSYITHPTLGYSKPTKASSSATIIDSRQDYCVPIEGTSDASGSENTDDTLMKSNTPTSKQMIKSRRKISSSGVAPKIIPIQLQSWPPPLPHPSLSATSGFLPNSSSTPKRGPESPQKNRKTLLSPLKSAGSSKITKDFSSSLNGASTPSLRLAQFERNSSPNLSSRTFSSRLHSTSYDSSVSRARLTVSFSDTPEHFDHGSQRFSPPLPNSISLKHASSSTSVILPPGLLTSDTSPEPSYEIKKVVGILKSPRDSFPFDTLQRGEKSPSELGKDSPMLGWLNKPKELDETEKKKLEELRQMAFGSSMSPEEPKVSSSSVLEEDADTNGKEKSIAPIRKVNSFSSSSIPLNVDLSQIVKRLKTTFNSTILNPLSPEMSSDDNSTKSNVGASFIKSEEKVGSDTRQLLSPPNTTSTPKSSSSPVFPLGNPDASDARVALARMMKRSTSAPQSTSDGNTSVVEASPNSSTSLLNKSMDSFARPRPVVALSRTAQWEAVADAILVSNARKLKRESPFQSPHFPTYSTSPENNDRSTKSLSSLPSSSAFSYAINHYNQVSRRERRDSASSVDEEGTLGSEKTRKRRHSGLTNGENNGIFADENGEKTKRGANLTTKAKRPTLASNKYNGSPTEKIGRKRKISKALPQIASTYVSSPVSTTSSINTSLSTPVLKENSNRNTNFQSSPLRVSNVLPNSGSPASLRRLKPAATPISIGSKHNNGIPASSMSSTATIPAATASSPSRARNDDDTDIEPEHSGSSLNSVSSSPPRRTVQSDTSLAQPNGTHENVEAREAECITNLLSLRSAAWK